jgi:hypothetical protein
MNNNGGELKELKAKARNESDRKNGRNFIKM